MFPTLLNCIYKITFYLIFVNNFYILKISITKALKIRNINYHNNRAHGVDIFIQNIVLQIVEVIKQDNIRPVALIHHNKVKDYVGPENLYKEMKEKLDMLKKR